MNNETILVSVIIPVYNVSTYLVQCLDSVICQSYRNIEIILINDGSTDDSSTICEQYATQDPRVCVYHIENSGASGARNFGLDRTKGSYILFADGDDWIEPDTVEVLLNTSLRYQADIVTARRIIEYVNQSILNTTEKPDRFFKGKDILYPYAMGTISSAVWDKLYRAECFSDLRFPIVSDAEDVRLSLKMLLRMSESDGTVVRITKSLFHYRMRKSSITHTKTHKKILDSWIAFYDRYKALPAFNDQPLYELFTVIGRMWRFYWRFSKEEKIKARDLLREMQQFSKAHRRIIMNSNCSISIKVICLMSQHICPPVMLMSYFGGVLFWKGHNNKHKTFS